jgi:AcrR family transcriptional regulator
MNEPRQDRRKLRTRTAALQAFAELFLEEGYEALTVAGVADRAGIGRSALYLHFRTKEDLLKASLARPFKLLAVRPSSCRRAYALHAGRRRLSADVPSRFVLSPRYRRSTFSLWLDANRPSNCRLCYMIWKRETKKPHILGFFLLETIPALQWLRLRNYEVDKSDVVVRMQVDQGVAN